MQKRAESAACKFFILAIFCLTVLWLYYDKPRARQEVYAAIDYLGTFDLRISGIPGFFGRSTFVDFPPSWLGIARTVAVELPSRIRELNQTRSNNKFSELKILNIDLKFGSASNLEKDRVRALRNGLSIEKDWYKFSGTFDKKKIRGHVRIKGDLNDHFRSQYRFSLACKLDKQSSSVFGMTRFAIQKPESRQYPHDAIFQKIAGALGLLATRHEFVRVFINGESMGVMDIEEMFSYDAIEKQKRKPSLILKQGHEEITWAISGTPSSPYGYYLDQVAEPEILQASRVLRNNGNRDLYSFISDGLEGERYQSIIDSKSFALHGLLALAWGTTHTLAANNSRMYANPFTLRLEPYSADQTKFIKQNKQFYENVQLPPIYAWAIHESIKDQKVDELIESVRLAVSNTIDPYYSQLRTIFPNDATLDFSEIFNNIDLLEKSILNQQFKGTYYGLDDKDKRSVDLEKEWIEHIYVTHFKDGNLVITNLTERPIAIKKIRAKNAIIWEGTQLIPASKDQMQRYRISTTAHGIFDGEISVVYEYNSRQYIAHNRYSRFSSSTTDQPQREIHSTEDCFTLPKGRHDISTPLVVKGCLRIESGAHANFSDGAYILVDGSFFAEGRSDELIVLRGHPGMWGGVIVRGDEKSETIVRHAEISRISGRQEGPLRPTGALSIYKSNVLMSDVVIDNIHTEDALNLIDVTFNINNLEISNSRSDALDLDFSNGAITNFSFKNINGDGLDTSGSNVLVADYIATNIRDKALSIGEESNLRGERIRISNTGVGIAVKDSSVATITDVYLEDIGLAAGMTYSKKNIYESPAKLEIGEYENSSSIHQYRYIRQNGSTLKLNGNSIPTEKLDVEELYRGDYMKKNAD
jgi:hypothetical protein